MSVDWSLKLMVKFFSFSLGEREIFFSLNKEYIFLVLIRRILFFCFIKESFFSLNKENIFFYSMFHNLLRSIVFMSIILINI